ncbi:transcriptional regulator [Halonotius sp. GCM10025705]|uniref:HVO_A0114 family putative DNA-binding protein n=1 Tax=Halonotius sp. GCM10025705 TaxID=3252678 RepID=UPI0036219FA8
MSNDTHTTPVPESTQYPETLRLTIQSGAAAFDAALEAVADDPAAAEAAVVSFETAEGIRRLLTDRRLELIQSLMAAPAASITELAERVDRSYSVVHEDIELLADTGIVKFRQDGQSKAPFIPYETVELDVTISAAGVAGGAELSV